MEVLDDQLSSPISRGDLQVAHCVPANPVYTAQMDPVQPLQRIHCGVRTPQPQDTPLPVLMG